MVENCRARKGRRVDYCSGLITDYVLSKAFQGISKVYLLSSDKSSFRSVELITIYFRIRLKNCIVFQTNTNFRIRGFRDHSNVSKYLSEFTKARMARLII